MSSDSIKGYFLCALSDIVYSDYVFSFLGKRNFEVIVLCIEI